MNPLEPRRRTRGRRGRTEDGPTEEELTQALAVVHRWLEGQKRLRERDLSRYRAAAREQHEDRARNLDAKTRANAIRVNIVARERDLMETLRPDLTEKERFWAEVDLVQGWLDHIEHRLHKELPQTREPFRVNDMGRVPVAPYALLRTIRNLTDDQRINPEPYKDPHHARFLLICLQELQIACLLAEAD